ncbi:MAG: hypothetical protein RL701_6467 [Pseudomonadota bacterium]|jgi:hypothetical protein
MLAVDDADGLDEVSISLLTALAQKVARRATCIVLIVDSDRSDALVRAQVLENLGERFRLSDTTWSIVFSENLNVEQRAALHARLARAFEASGTVARRAHHWPEPSEQVQMLAERSFRLERSESTLADPSAFAAEEDTQLITNDGAFLYPVVLVSHSGGDSVLAGVALLETGDSNAINAPAGVIDALASALLEHDDVDPATCMI